MFRAIRSHSRSHAKDCFDCLRDQARHSSSTTHKNPFKKGYGERENNSTFLLMLPCQARELHGPHPANECARKMVTKTSIAETCLLPGTFISCGRLPAWVRPFGTERIILQAIKKFHLPYEIISRCARPQHETE